MRYIVTEDRWVWVESLGREVRIKPDAPLDESDPTAKAVIKEWKDRGVMYAPNVEAATAAPGELRSTRRKPAA
jgi:hypothetical protein